ncbi:hypothetical protein [Parafrankia sp. EUN1f]|uniref:hypothetical protein n=1 Tax=Parafrankia sp. EUN1f TaxID=102897 RepID=UPI0001C45583|nr:hypothetical protein [Parafrankia sp. EUN1f]EFC86474.1 hypothetical protein FrEUN1fDRAFT_0369 [Parafrankia sp. EUN1f]
MAAMMTEKMFEALLVVARGYAHTREQVFGTIHPDARTEFYADSGSHNRLRGGTMNALISRGLVTRVDVRTIGALEVSTLALTDAGWQALAGAYGVEVRPADDRPTVVVLSARQAGGYDCVNCGTDLTTPGTVSRPVGSSPVGQVFACLPCSGAQAAPVEAVTLTEDEAYALTVFARHGVVRPAMFDITRGALFGLAMLRLVTFDGRAWHATDAGRAALAEVEPV